MQPDSVWVEEHHATDDEPLSGRGKRKCWAFLTFPPVLIVGFACLVFAITILLVLLFKPSTSSSAHQWSDCEIYCDSELLRQVQRAHLFNSSKAFVDMPMKFDPDVIEKKFAALLATARAEGLLGADGLIPVANLSRFVRDNFDHVRSDVESWVPDDFGEDPHFAIKIKDDVYRAWAVKVHKLWLLLGLEPARSVYTNPVRNSLIGTRHQFIVPGDRFREVYYWDTYWVLKGLYVSAMNSTARGMIDNLNELVDTFGFVPNGNRRYYLNRSQPPLLTQMHADLYAHLAGIQLTHTGLPDPAAAASVEVSSNSEQSAATSDFSSESSVLSQLAAVEQSTVGGSQADSVDELFRDRDFALFAQRGTPAASAAKDKQSSSTGNSKHGVMSAAEKQRRLAAVRKRIGLTINRQQDATPSLDQARAVLQALPVLEREYKFWMTDGHALTVNWNNTNYRVNRYYVNTTRPRPESFREDEQTAKDSGAKDVGRVYSELAAGAESGWDYSSRWFADRRRILTIDTRNVIPVDLNSIMCRNERSLAFLHSEAENVLEAELYAQAYVDRVKMMSELLWEPKLNQWVDYRINEARNGSTGIASNFFPLWAGCFPTSFKTAPVLQALRNSGLKMEGGISTTDVRFFDMQQWDYPNAWAPIQHMWIEGLLNLNTDESRALAFEIASTWVATNYLAFQKKGFMYEKYDARHMGEGGGGGEYEVQIGFGWTNGVALDLLNRYASELIHPPLVKREREIAADNDNAANDAAKGASALPSAIVFTQSAVAAPIRSSLSATKPAGIVDENGEEWQVDPQWRPSQRRSQLSPAEIARRSALEAREPPCREAAKGREHDKRWAMFRQKQLDKQLQLLRQPQQHRL